MRTRRAGFPWGPGNKDRANEPDEDPHVLGETRHPTMWSIAKSFVISCTHRPLRAALDGES